MNNNRARFGLVILRIQTNEPARLAILPDVGIADEVTASRCRFGPMNVREVLDPSAVAGVGPFSMGHQIVRG